MDINVRAIPVVPKVVTPPTAAEKGILGQRLDRRRSAPACTF